MPAMTPLPSVLELSLSAADTYEFRLVGEGARNIVFDVLGPHRDGASRNIFHGNLLRVPKVGTKAHSYEEHQQYWETVIKPLFKPEYLAEPRLIRLAGEATVSRLNIVLENEDTNRRADFRGSRVAAAEYGMLVEDMRQKHPDDVTFEFKPKWLAQSANAPPSATRCRNCAREALKHHDNPKPDKPAIILCPLDFLACRTSRNALTNVVRHLSSHDPRLDPATGSAQQRSRLTGWLESNALLPRLRDAQVALDRTGPLGADVRDAHFQLAMTLRDCTCFVRIPADPGAPVEAKLADLDKKNAAAKLGYWQAMERRLLEGGYYEGREVPRLETDCQLGREPAVGGG